MNTGQMRNKIKLLQKKEPEPPFVDLTDEYIFVAEVSAKKEDKLSPSIWGAMAENSINSKQFVIRYRKDVNAGMRLQYDTEVYNIKAVAELGNNRQWIVVLAERVDNIGV